MLVLTAPKAGIHTLPSEILREIFTLCTETTICPGLIITNSSQLLPAPFLLASICCLWRKLILNTPAFWRNLAIVIDAYRLHQLSGRREAMFIAIRTWLYRSHPAPILLTISTSRYADILSDAQACQYVLNFLEDLYNLLAMDCRRWKEVSLFLPQTAASYFMTLLDEKRYYLSRLTGLLLHKTPQDNQHELAFGHTAFIIPSLQHLSLVGYRLFQHIGASIFRGHGPANLVELTIDETDVQDPPQHWKLTLDHALLLLSHYRNTLERCHIGKIQPQDSSIINTPTMIYEFPRLRSLTVDFWTGACDREINSIPWFILIESFFERITASSRLQHLTVRRYTLPWSALNRAGVRTSTLWDSAAPTAPFLPFIERSHPNLLSLSLTAVPVTETSLIDVLRLCSDLVELEVGTYHTMFQSRSRGSGADIDWDTPLVVCGVLDSLTPRPGLGPTSTESPVLCPRLKKLELGQKHAELDSPVSRYSESNTR
ncbi:hypothetical protein V5O48_008394 [Marasmius crinis-equi]|uniref:F-box domain-containing protein n=1 Tax=Marasmius crinis-equi TaxID=585013 RepID=A0ABR3FE65_9AGAR